MKVAKLQKLLIITFTATLLVVTIPLFGRVGIGEQHNKVINVAKLQNVVMQLLQHYQ